MNVTQNLQQLITKHYISMYVVQLDIEPHAKFLPDLLGDVVKLHHHHTNCHSSDDNGRNKGISEGISEVNHR